MWVFLNMNVGRQASTCVFAEATSPFSKTAVVMGLGFRGLGCRNYWVAVKELKLSYHNGYI